MQFSSATPNAFGEPHGMPLDVSTGKPRFLCKEEVEIDGNRTRLCNKEIGENGCGGNHVFTRPTPFIKKVASGQHGNSISRLVRRRH